MFRRAGAMVVVGWLGSQGLGFAGARVPGLSELQGTAANGGGTITGTVTTTVRAPRPIRVTFDQRVCGTTMPDAAIVVNGAGQLANAVVTLAGAKARAPKREALVVNDGCAFVPRVQVVAPGGTVKTSSRDPMLHTTVLQLPDGRQLFNVALPAPGIEVTKPIGATGILRVGCSTHQWMRGWLIVSDELAAVTGADGRFTLTGVPPGTYELRVWHETLTGTTRTVTVEGGKTTTVGIEVR